MVKRERKYRVLILESRSGGGHVSISKAVSEAVEEKYPVVVAREDAVSTLEHKFYRMALRQTSSAMADLFQVIYKLSNNPESAELSSRINLILNRKKFVQLIEKHQPDLIFSDTSLAVREVPRLLNKYYRRIPFLVFVADPVSVHCTWFSPLTDLTMVPTIHVYQTALQQGLNPEQVMITGHPVRRQFLKRQGAKNKLRENLGLEPGRFTILFGGSGEGAEELVEILQRLGDLKAVFQGIVVTGNNPKLKAEIGNLVKSRGMKVTVFGFVEEMAPLLQASDLVVAKAGPNLIFEAAMAGVPFLATHHIRGQEDGNLDIIRHAQIGWVEEDPEKATLLIGEIIKNPEMMKATRLGIKYFGQIHRGAADKIAKIIYKYLTGAIPITVSWEEKTLGAGLKADLHEEVEKLRKRVKAHPEIVAAIDELKENWGRLKRLLETVE